MNDQKIEQLEQKIDAVYSSVEKMRKYFFWTMVISISAVVVPLIGLAFALPAFLSNYTAALGGTM